MKILHAPSRSVHSLGRLMRCKLGNVTTCMRRTRGLKCRSPRVFTFVRRTLTRLAHSSVAMSRLADLILRAKERNMSTVTRLSATGARACNGPRLSRIGVNMQGGPNVLIDKRSLGSLRRLLRRARNAKVSVCARDRVLPTRCCPRLGGCGRLTKGCKGT